MPSRAETVEEALSEAPESPAERDRQLAAYRNALRRVSGLHRPYGRTRDGKGGWCWADNNTWPCKTWQMLEEELLP
jgi:hypothetical protein